MRPRNLIIAAAIVLGVPAGLYGAAAVASSAYVDARALGVIPDDSAPCAVSVNSHNVIISATGNHPGKICDEIMSANTDPSVTLERVTATRAPDATDVCSYTLADGTDVLVTDTGAQFLGLRACSELAKFRATSSGTHS